MRFQKMKIHKLSAVPTAYEEQQKILDSKDPQIIESNLENLEIKRRKEDEEAILNLINTHGKSEIPLVEMLSIKEKTYKEALNNILSLRNPETFEAMMLLFTYMESKKSFKIERLTGLELLKLGGYIGTKQHHRDAILRRIEKNTGSVIKALDPAESTKNYKNKKSQKGLVYENYYLVKVKKIVYSKQNPNLIVELQDIEFLPEYIEYIHQISRRYIPLQTIQQIPKETGKDKTRHFLYKLCFKFAGMKKSQCELNLEECMNLGKFHNKKERNIKRKWKPIIKALEAGQQANLIDFHFTLKETGEQKIKIQETEYKAIEKVIITRLYALNAPQLQLPFQIEEKEANTKPIEVTF